MDLLFWRKNVETVEVKELRVLVVPPEKVKIVCHLSDELYGAKGHGRLAKYELWNKIEEILPETKGGNWTIN